MSFVLSENRNDIKSDKTVLKYSFYHKSEWSLKTRPLPEQTARMIHNALNATLAKTILPNYTAR